MFDHTIPIAIVSGTTFSLLCQHSHVCEKAAFHFLTVPEAINTVLDFNLSLRPDGLSQLESLLVYILLLFGFGIRVQVEFEVFGFTFPVVVVVQL